ncbi:uncharacterized membrane protein (UPF0136 family) [Chryseobacterium ginsenosidimutans]|uniref:hypothetical protein n=1 Tax=Chryseobacterium ginsenosidimutans TaxID=687846 RepID=UPI002784488D|nr:hypothetical protein [Chryseobacterium ginsenosidimutans]MDQ0594400.1 uncharacterized membrane protein (UPF0136 family) [Chryseobacterium ginsenosidimutans]
MKSKVLVKILLSVYLCMMSYYLYTHQYYNVDIEAYMGLVYKANFPDMKIEDIHKKVYDELKEKKPEVGEINTERKEEAVGDNSYYKNLSENPKMYKEELQLFTVKPLYNFINSIFFKLGFKASTSTFLITIISYVLIVILIFIFLLQILKNNYLALVLTILISLFKPLLDASRHATPDGLSTLLLLLSFYYAVMKKNIFIATVFGILCILTRPEYFIFYSFLLLLLYIFKADFGFKTKEITFSFIYFALTFGIIQYFNQIPWSVLFMNQFTKVQLYPISNPDSFNFYEYLACVKGKVLLEFNTSYFPLLLIFIIIILDYKLLISRNRKSLIFLSLYLAVYLSVSLRFMMFPSLVNRMMVGFYLIIILSLIAYQNSKKQILAETA